MMGANHYNLDLGHEDTYYPAVFREIWTNRPTSLYPSYSTERGLPYTLPGILKFDIKDDSIFEIKEVEDVYEDGGLSSFGNTPAMKYYLVPKKAGTTTLPLPLRTRRAISMARSRRSPSVSIALRRRLFRI